MDVKKYQKASEISKKCKEYGKSIAKSGMNYLEFSKKIENKILELGGGIAFPVNISVNDTAAHDIAQIDDTRVFEKGDLVKLDIGVHIDGFIVDSAITFEIETDNHSELIKLNRRALDEALKVIKPGVKVSEIGKAVEKVVKGSKYKIIKNLTGHGIEQYDIHSGFGIPNYDTKTNDILERGMVIAVEPFLTDGDGMIKSGKSSGIYQLESDKPVRLYRDVLNFIKKEFLTLPFNIRDIQDKFGYAKAKSSIAYLVRNELLTDHQVLLEKRGSVVSQFEHTIIVEDKPIILG
ncbi:MAG: type II methionyl aminopeptidase [Candidatus Woesearchaeota archaeon]